MIVSENFLKIDSLLYVITNIENIIIIDVMILLKLNLFNRKNIVINIIPT